MAEPVALALTREQARRLHLAAQGLLSTPRLRATKETLLAAIARMQLLQIDTIHVVARSPYLVLFSRAGAYPMGWLEELLEEGRIFECWAHEACFAPAADFALHRRRVDQPSTHWALKRARQAHVEHRASMAKLLAHVRELGAVRAADFDAPPKRDGVAGGWWGWKDEKRWLEALFATGELMIARRQNFQRVYDLTERVAARVAPGWDGVTIPSVSEARSEIIRKTVAALGVARLRWIADYFRLGERGNERELAPLLETGEVVRVTVEGWDGPTYVHRQQLEPLGKGLRARAKRTTLLSPFDPVVWDRARARELFDFDYRLECYTPEAKRRYGYFVLPILCRGELVGRLDAKAHRAPRGETPRFEVKALFLEARVAPTEELADEIARAIADCAAWHGTPRVTLGRTAPRGFAPLLRAALRRAGALR
jgi:uncharacterized protein